MLIVVHTTDICRVGTGIEEIYFKTEMEYSTAVHYVQNFTLILKL